MESSPSPLISSLFTDYFRLFLAVGPSNVATAGPNPVGWFAAGYVFGLGSVVLRNTPAAVGAVGLVGLIVGVLALCRFGVFDSFTLYSLFCSSYP